MAKGDHPNDYQGDRSHWRFKEALKKHNAQKSDYLGKPNVQFRRA
jgi:hypothetical protein